MTTLSGAGGRIKTSGDGTMANVLNGPRIFGRWANSFSLCQGMAEHSIGLSSSLVFLARGNMLGGGSGNAGVRRLNVSGERCARLLAFLNFF